MSCYFLSAADFHRPLSSVGNGLTPEERAPLQGLIKKTQLLFKKTALSYSAEELSSVVDIIYGYAAAKNEFAARILSEYIRYLRISIISVPLLHVKNSTIIIDVTAK